jgi:tRNA pseudouridine55 synthase
MTSHDVVARARRALSVRKVGHAGTLDPMATGLLLLGVGAATRLLGHLAGSDKTYEATIRLGATTVTDDREGEVLASVPAGALDDDAVRSALAAQTGALAQVPSSVSAVKVAGVRSYDRVRAGETVELAPRHVTVHRLEVHRIDRSTPDVLDVDVTVECTAGTYVRAIARDAGAALGVGGHLTALRRTASGPFRVADAVGVEDAAAALVAGGGPGVLGLTEAATSVFPRRRLTEEEAVDLGHGRRVPATGTAGLVAAVSPEGRLVALTEDAGALARVAVGFPAPGMAGSSA